MIMMRRIKRTVELLKPCWEICSIENKPVKDKAAIPIRLGQSIPIVLQP